MGKISMTLQEVDNGYQLALYREPEELIDGTHEEALNLNLVFNDTVSVLATIANFLVGRL